MDSDANSELQQADGLLALLCRSLNISFISTSIFLLFMTYILFLRNTDSSNLPAGPKPLPLIGNLHQMWNKQPIDCMQKWHREYGTMVTLRYGQQLAISISSFDISQDLTSKRGAIYSSRPRYVVASERMTSGFNAAIMPYGKRWQNQHRIMNSMLEPATVSHYSGVLDLESKQALFELLATSDFEACLSRYAGSVLMTLGHGIWLEETSNDVPAKLLQLNSHPFEAIANSYYQIVELFSILDKLPSVLAPWKRFSAGIEQQTTEFHMKHFETAKSQSPWNWVRSDLHSKIGSEISSKELAYVEGTLEQAGFEAMFTVLRLLIKAIVLHPHCLEEAQRELDSIVGPNRLPSFEDLPRLPYIKALIHEAMRWQPPAPLALPHATTQDDEYMGYRIPKGTIIIPNVWVMSSDAGVFPDPLEFKPQRWIHNPELEHSPFGFGRRICPGRHLAWNSIFILIARLMWAYNITHVSNNGKRVEIDPWDVEIGFTARPKPFSATFQARNAKMQEIIQADWSTVCKDHTRLLDAIQRRNSARR